MLADLIYSQEQIDQRIIKDVCKRYCAVGDGALRPTKSSDELTRG